MEFMNTYIKQGRFGEFVANILEMDHKRKQEAAKKENDDRLWSIYIRSDSSKSFKVWKEELAQRKEPEVYSMTDKQVADVKQQAMGILKKISPV